MSIVSVQRCNNDFVLNDKVNRRYQLVFDGSSYRGYDNSSVITVKNRREVELLLLCLGEEAGVFMDSQARKLYPEVWDWLFGRTYKEVLKSLKWSYREEKEVFHLIKRILVPDILRSYPNSLNRGDLQPERIKQEYVQKIYKDNVLISKPYQLGKMFYFQGFKSSTELIMDHSSEYLEEMIIVEEARQAGIASAHLIGMPLSGDLVILKAITQYTSFVKYNEPYLIHTIPVIPVNKQKGGVGYCVYNIIQRGQSCVTGYFTGIVYNSKNNHTFRNSKLLAKNKLFVY